MLSKRSLRNQKPARRERSRIDWRLRLEDAFWMALFWAFVILSFALGMLNRCGCK